MRHNRGFTILELIIVMAIMAIIASVLYSNFAGSLAKGRDSRRKQDLEGAAKALELFYGDFRSYPNPTLNILPTWGAPFANPTNTAVIYMQQMPVDPAYPDKTYCYISENGSNYKLYANLENLNDPKVFTTPVQCGTVYYNYGISSQNTTP